MKALILYHTKTGHTLEAANAIAQGITDAGGEVTLASVKEFVPAAIADYDVLVVGSPCWKGSVGADGIAGPVDKALATIGGEVRGKLCAGFSVNAGAGGENTVRSLGAVLNHKGCQRYVAGPVARAGVPLSLWKGPAVKEEDLQRFRAFGAELARG
jgi:NAD(P)H dehydrogenase (quinone)